MPPPIPRHTTIWIITAIAAIVTIVSGVVLVERLIPKTPAVRGHDAAATELITRYADEIAPYLSPIGGEWTSVKASCGADHFRCRFQMKRLNHDAQRIVSAIQAATTPPVELVPLLRDTSAAGRDIADDTARADSMTENLPANVARLLYDIDQWNTLTSP